MRFQGSLTCLLVVLAAGASAAERPSAPHFTQTGEALDGAMAAVATPACAAREFSDFLALSGVDFYPETESGTVDRRAHLAVKDGQVFWTDASEFPLWKANFDARTVTPLALRVGTPERIVATEDAIWWIEQEIALPFTCAPGRGRQLRRAARDGSNVTLVGAWSNCQGSFSSSDLLVDQSSVYLIMSQALPSGAARYVLIRAPQAGGPGVELAEASEPIFSLAQDESFLYWTERRHEDSLVRVRRVPKTGGPAETLLDGTGSPTFGLARVGDDLLLALVDGLGRNRIVTLPVTGGTPTTVLEIANDSGHTKTVRHLATDGTNVYWLDRNALRSVPLAGGEPAMLASVPIDGNSLAAAGGQVFWTESPIPVPGVIKSVPAGGGAVVTVVSNLQKPGAVFVLDDSLYWPEPGRIATAPIGGGAQTTLVGGLSATFQPVVTDGVNVYIADENTVKSVPVAGGRVEKLASFGLSTPVSDLATDGAFVYFNVRGSLAKVPVTGGPVSYLILNTNTTALAAAGESLFWFHRPAGGGSEISQIAKDGGPVTTLADGLDSFLGDLVADERYVFFSSEDTGLISRMPVTGGAITTVGYGYGLSWNRLAIGGTGLYWISQAGRVWTVEKDGGPIGYVSTSGNSDVFLPDAVAADDTHVYYTNVKTGSIVRATLRPRAFAFEVASSTIAESGKAARIRVRRTGALSGPAAVDYAASDGTAVAGSDYTPTSGMLNFAEGVSVQTFTVPILNDSVAEGTETILLQLREPGCAQLGAQDTAVLTVSDDAVPTVELQLARYATREDRGSVVVTARRLGSAGRPFTVDYATQDGTAHAGQDYTQTTGTLVFGPNVSVRTIEVPIADDTVFDPSESFVLKLAHPVAGSDEVTLGKIREATITIADNDQAFELSTARTVVGEATRRAVINVKRVGGAQGRVTVGYAATGGTATSGADYTLPPGTLTFGPGQTTSTITVTLNNDTLVEGSETIEVSLLDPVGATIVGANPLVLTIADNQPSFQFRAATFEVTEGARKALVVVERTGVLAGAASVSYEVSAGSATLGVDYSPTTGGTLTFASGQSAATIAIVPVDDALAESPETITLTLSSASAGYAIGAPAIAVLTIEDNDTPSTLQFSAPAFSAIEGTPAAAVTVTRTGGTGVAASVHYSTSDGTAVAGTGYVETSGTLTLAAGETTRTFVIEILDDGVATGNRFLNLTLTDASFGSAVGTPSSAVLWVVDRQ